MKAAEGVRIFVKAQVILYEFDPDPCLGKSLLAVSLCEETAIIEKPLAANDH